MKKDVLIEIKGVYRQDGEEDSVELFTTGSYYKRNGHYYIAYDESEVTGFEGSRTVLKVEESGRVTLTRSGLTDEGGRLEFAYSLDVNTLLASENAVYINVREQPQS